MVRPVIKFFQCLSRFPHFDARFTVASYGPNSPIGGILFLLVVSYGKDALKFVDNLIKHQLTKHPCLRTEVSP